MATHVPAYPAIEALKRQGWTFLGRIDNSNNGFRMSSPNEGDQRLHFVGRNHNPKSKHRYLFGIRYLYFKYFDYFVLFAHKEPYMLLTPVRWLNRLFVSETPKVDAHQRWHINAYLHTDSAGSAKVRPVNYSALVDASEFKIPFLENHSMESKAQVNRPVESKTQDKIWTENQIKYAFRKHRSRDTGLRQFKIDQTLTMTGRLKCEVPRCGFDFAIIYGSLGINFAHVHHNSALSESDQPILSTPDKLTIVCPNCHEMIHRWMRRNPDRECPLDSLIVEPLAPDLS